LVLSASTGMSAQKQYSGSIRQPMQRAARAFLFPTARHLAHRASVSYLKGMSLPPKKPARASEQPFKYPLERAFVEPDWRRIPAYKDVTVAEWESSVWQRKHTIKNLKELEAALGDKLPRDLRDSIERDQHERATMSILFPPQMLNTMDISDLWNDRVRRYMLPAFADRRTDWPSHPKASRDSLHEAEMWAVEGLTHRYPTKVLAELL